MTSDKTRHESHHSFNYKLNLIKEMAWADFKLKYHGSVFGLLWSFLKPFLMLMVLYIVFDKFIKTGIENYPVYLLLGIIFWNFFTDTTKDSMRSLKGKSAILQKTKISPGIIVLSSCLHSFMTFLINIVIFFFVYLLFGLQLEFTNLFLIVFILLYFIFTVGVSLLTSLLHMRFNDFSHLWDVFLQILFWATPIVYSQTMIPPGYHELFLLNPIARIIVDTRNVVLFDFIPEAKQLIITLVLIATIVTFSILLFKRYQRKWVENL